MKREGDICKNEINWSDISDLFSKIEHSWSDGEMTI